MIQGKQNGSKARQNGGKSSQIADQPTIRVSESSDLGQNDGHHHPLATPEGGDSLEGMSNGCQTWPGTPQQMAPSGEAYQDSSRQNGSLQDTAGQHSLDRASQRRPGHPQEQKSTSSQNSGLPRMQGFSSRRRSMERQSASLTLPFEQLNFVFHHINYSVPATVGLTHIMSSIV